MKNKKQSKKNIRKFMITGALTGVIAGLLTNLGYIGFIIGFFINPIVVMLRLPILDLLFPLLKQLPFILWSMVLIDIFLGAISYGLFRLIIPSKYRALFIKLFFILFIIPAILFILINRGGGY